jgi:hypothetical protein
MGLLGAVRNKEPNEWGQTPMTAFDKGMSE